MNSSFLQLREDSWLQCGANYLEAFYQDFLRDPTSVEPEWRAVFSAFEHTQDGSGAAGLSKADMEVLSRKQNAVWRLIAAYRHVGYKLARLDPLERQEAPAVRELELESYGLTAADLDLCFHAGSLETHPGATLAEILAILRETYCRSIGAEYMHIETAEQRHWIKRELEKCRARPQYDGETKKRILAKLLAAQMMELSLHRKFVGQKRFSLEGGESLIPLLDGLVHQASAMGVKEMVIGMAHRGRLNVLINVLGKRTAELFDEFEGRLVDPGATSGDVKYHKGFSSLIETASGVIHLALAPNPSHLELVNPVVEGSVRARQERRGDSVGDSCLAVLIHGDAAVAGQGVVPETLNLSKTRGYRTGGTVHVVINNQIGFTTSDPRDVSSMTYCTDIFRMVQAPVFHVNGDDPEAVMLALELALKFRAEFHVDVVIDLVCFRLRGHNEADEPHVTQPLMYQSIDRHPGTPRLYADKLIAEGLILDTDYQDGISTYVKGMEAGECMVEGASPDTRPNLWKQYLAESHGVVDTTIGAAKLQSLAQVLGRIPEGFHAHKIVEKLVQARLDMARGVSPVDWGMAELLAYASLLSQGYGVRLSGEDCGRGTFAHRHAVYHDQERTRRDGGTYIPLSDLGGEQGAFRVIDSLLSEEAVLGFEYGYSTADPLSLVIWEAQFGDFANGAQAVIDQFIVSGEAKWGRHSGLVLFLPHGLEGQGPEHSSARLERYLQLCAEENIQVCQPTTPAQLFHMLRRQMLSSCRKPLVVMTPKSLLRHKQVVSSLEELANGSFKAVLDDSSLSELGKEVVRRVVLCSGKLYYDLLDARAKSGREYTALVRLEQLYPFPEEELAQVLATYPRAEEVVWAQDEHRNQGSWTFVLDQYYSGALSPRIPLRFAGRARAAAPATGLHNRHVTEQKQVVESALG